MSIGVTETSAQKMFAQIISEASIGDYSIKGVTENIKLRQLCHPLGWLSHWMLKSDEYSIFLTGTRLWNVGYIAENKAMEGVTPIRKELLTDLQKHPSYERFDLYDEQENTTALKYLISKHALLNTLNVDGNEVSIKPIRGFYGLSKPLKSAEPLPLPREDLIVALELNRMICNFNRKRVHEKTRQKIRDMNLEGLGL